MPRKKKKVEPEPVEILEIAVERPHPEKDIAEIIPIEPEGSVVDVEKVKLQIFKDTVAKMVDEAPTVLAVRENPMLYGEFLYALKRSLT